MKIEGTGHILAYTFFIVLAIFFLCVRMNRVPGRIQAVSDTIFITRVDTIRDTVLKPVQVKIRTIQRDTLYVPVLDMPTEVEIPISEYHFKDSSYHIQLTGYNVVAERIEVYPVTTIKTVNTIQREKIRPKFGVGIHAGYGIDVRNARLSPYVGIGIHYNLFSF